MQLLCRCLPSLWRTRGPFLCLYGVSLYRTNVHIARLQLDASRRYDRFRGLTPRTRFIPISDTCVPSPPHGASSERSPCSFLRYLRADGVFLPATVPDPPVHGDVEGQEFDWGDSNAQHGADAAAANSQNFDLTEVQNAIGSVSAPFTDHYV